MATPNFFVVGAPKAGTTSLYHYLDQHPAVYMSPIKEPWFFAPDVVDVTPGAREILAAGAAALRAYLDGPMREKREHGFVLEWEQYLKLFKNVRDETALGEGSVSYLASLGAAGAIRARLPHARIIMVLRDPVDRLFSRYQADRDASATVTFAQWVTAQVSADATRRPPSGPIWHGRYSLHLRRYLECFPPGQVRVYLYDDYVRAPVAVLRDLFSFLGVDPDHPIDTGHRYNVTLAPRWPALHASLVIPFRRAIRAVLPAGIATRARRWYLTPRRPRPTAEERARVIEIYEEDIRTLEGLIHRDLSGWLSPHRSHQP